MAIKQYQPKGGMCGNCEKLTHDCSKLDFKNMQVIEENYYSDRMVIVVRCTEFIRKTKKVMHNPILLT